MASARHGETLARLLERTGRAQADAADPSSSAWVSANAGTGKTHVLTMRVLRLLLAGTPPERILCLTYTKAAAAEMSTRVFDRLAGWVTIPEEELSGTLGELLGRTPAPAELARARTLFTRAIETPGGFKVQTIHAFCERLLQRFPLESDVPPNFSILDDALAASLVREAIDEVLTAATREPGGPLGRALATTVAYAADERFDDLLAAALAERAWLETATRIDLGLADDELAGTERLIRRALHIDGDLTIADIEHRAAQVVSDTDLVRGAELLARGKSTDVDTATRLRAAATAGVRAARIESLARALLTKEGKPRADTKFVTKAMQKEDPALYERLSAARFTFGRLLGERKAVAVADATIALLRLASAVMQGYAHLKARRAALDFDDLIAKTASLLGPTPLEPESGAAQWVLFKLDGGLDHILVDESQDTSPPQWRIVDALAREFFSGQGARELVRTLFAVGDEKQSIYSFQGAAPEKFAEMGGVFETAARQAGTRFKTIPLDVSFRSAEPILAAVDAVFAEPGRTPGLTAGQRAIQHVASRLGQAGLVEIWPTETHGDAGETDVWQPLDERTDPSPVARLAERIADTIARWLASGERLTSEDRPLTPGDILILLRRRRPFAAPMLAALKARKIPVAGADRMRLTAQPAVADLMALADFLTLPEDDLALATVLKSPLFGFDDDDLLRLAHGRRGTLWKSLIDAREIDPRYAFAHQTLRRWRAKADFAPPFEFLSQLLDRDGMRTRLLERLGAEAADAIDELISLAMAYDDRALPSLTGFLAWLRESEREIKRDMEHGRNEVRIMTVHGAKGLEAPIVILPDTCSAPSGNRRGIELLELEAAERPPGAPAPFLWPIKGAGVLAPVAAAIGAARQRDVEEYHRLLYVAMTRARDRLYITGFEGKKPRPAGCWYDLVHAAMAPAMEARIEPDGRRVLYTASGQSQPAKASRGAGKAATVPVGRPDWATRPAPHEPQPAIPLVPSRLAPYEVDEAGDPLPAATTMAGSEDPPAPRPSRMAQDGRFLRGTLTHALLQHLPSLPETARAAAAEVFLATRGAALSARVRSQIVDEALAILADPAFSALFGSQSRAEVPIAAVIPPTSGRGAALRINGQIDRLALVDGEVLVVDYKTNRPPPTRAEDIAEAYLLQLAAYRLALAEIYPGRRVRAAILWTDGPRIMEIAEQLLERVTPRLWDLSSQRLDA